MENLDDITSLTEYRNIKTIQILRTSEASAEKEFIKEFFRFIGCLISDVPIKETDGFMPPESKKDGQSAANHDVDLFVLTHWDQWNNLSSLFESIRVRFPNRRVVGVYCSLDDKKFQITGTDTQQQEASSKKQLTEAVLEGIIDQIWYKESETAIRNSLHCINKQYHVLKLFPFLQIKRTFRIVNMNEVLAYGTERYSIPFMPYIPDMLNAFYLFRQNLLEGRRQSVYAIYSCTNAARKIREIYQVLSSESTLRKEKVIPMTSASELLDELKGIYQMDSSYFGVYYLAAYICQTDSEKKMDAFNYYKNAFIHARDEENAFSSSGSYQLGHYVQKELGQEERSLTYYLTALSKNEQCYQSFFQISRYRAENTSYSSARAGFLKVIDILSRGNDLTLLPSDLPCRESAQIKEFDRSGYHGWGNLSLKDILYLYKSYIWLARISADSGDDAESTAYIKRALSAAIAYWRAPILRKCLDPEEWSKVQNVHVHGLPVRALFVTLQRAIKSTVPSSILAEQIKNDIAHYEDICKKATAKTSIDPHKFNDYKGSTKKAQISL